MLRVNLTDEPRPCRRELACGSCGNMTRHVSFYCRACRRDRAMVRKADRRAERRAKLYDYPDPCAALLALPRL